MRICLRDIDDKVRQIFDTVVAVRCDRHEGRASALDFDHIADCLFVELRLCQRADDQNIVLDQADRSVLQFSCSVGVRVNVADLFHFQAAFQADRIVKPAADEEHILRVDELGGEPLESLLVLEKPLGLCRKRGELSQQSFDRFLIQISAYLRELNREKIEREKLGAVGFCRCDGNLRTGLCVKDVLCFSGDRASHHIDDRHRRNVLFICKAESSKGIRGLSGL